MKSYLNYSGVAVLAHRGGSIESFENTIESFHYSQSLGCKFIETDVQVSSDGIPYIFHGNKPRYCRTPEIAPFPLICRPGNVCNCPRISGVLD